MHVVLPPLVVMGLSDEKPWQYARLDELEVLTVCGEAITAQFLAAEIRSRLFLPDDFRVTGSKPMRFILYDQFIGEEAPRPSGIKTLQDAELGEGWSRVTNLLGEVNGVVAANLFEVHSWPVLSMAQLDYYFNNCLPAAPPWLRKGLLSEHGALMPLASYKKNARLARLSAYAWDRVAEVKSALATDNEGRGIYPLFELFESPPPDEPAVRLRWELQAALFCRWQIYSPEGQRNGGNGFWNWARLARKGPVDEEDFKRCIGMDYAAAEKKMLKYLDRVLGVPQDVPIRLYPLEDDLKLRSATEEEIARMLGEFQWQEAKRLRSEGDFEQSMKYELAARRTYIRGLARTKGAARLRAGLGLLEYEGGCRDESRVHLEKALAGKGADSRALLALSRLRFEEAKGLADAGRRLNAEQIVHLLTPAIMTRDLPPVAVDVYRLLGEVWAMSSFTPEARHLNVLLEGVANYPHDLDLALQVAELHLLHGHIEIGRAVAQRAAKLAGRSRYKERFELLLAGLGQP